MIESASFFLTQCNDMATNHVKFHLEHHLRLVIIIGDDKHVVNVNIQCLLYGDAHDMELVAYPTYILMSCFHGAEFAVKC